MILILFDVYLKWFHLEKIYSSDIGSLNFLYFIIFIQCILNFLVKHLIIHFMVFCNFLALKNPVNIYGHNYQHSQLLSIALIVSSFPKLLLILMIIWDYNAFSNSWLVDLLVVTSNIEALRVFLKISYLKSTALVGCGIMSEGILHLAISYFAPSINI